MGVAAAAAAVEQRGGGRQDRIRSWKEVSVTKKGWDGASG